MSLNERVPGLTTVALVDLAVLLACLIFSGCVRTSPIVEAAQAGDLNTVKLLISQGTPINEKSRSKGGWTGLMAAAATYKTNVVHYLIEARDDNGDTALMWAIGLGDEGIIITLLRS